MRLLNIIKFKKLLNCCSTVNLKHFSSSSSDGAKLLTENIGAVAAFAINIPERKNELDEETFENLCGAVERFEKDDNVVAGVIYGVGGNFCTGCSENFVPDIKKLISPRRKPLVAGLTGYTTGFGFELALACDLRVMEGTAQIGLGGCPVEMSTFFYQRLLETVGLSHAMDLALTGRNLTWREAHQCGLANRMVDCGTGVGQAIQLAKSIAKFPVPALRAAKSAVYSNLPSQ